MPLMPRRLAWAAPSETWPCESRRELELRATKQTTWSRLKLAPNGPLHASFNPRSICSLDSVVDLPEDTLFDYCGVVVGCSCSAQGEP